MISNSPNLLHMESGIKLILAPRSIRVFPTVTSPIEQGMVTLPGSLCFVGHDVLCFYAFNIYIYICMYVCMYMYIQKKELHISFALQNFNVLMFSWFLLVARSNGRIARTKLVYLNKREVKRGNSHTLILSGDYHLLIF